MDYWNNVQTVIAKYMIDTIMALIANTTEINYLLNGQYKFRIRFK